MGRESSALERAGSSMAAVAVTATFSQMAFARAAGVTFPLLSDWSGEVADAYGVRYEEWKGHAGVAKRSVFVIDTDRVIRYRWVTDDALILPPLDEALDVILDRDEGGTYAAFGPDT